MNVTCDCTNAVTRAVVVGTTNDWQAAKRTRAARPIVSANPLLLARDQAVIGNRGENYAWLALALCSLSLLVLSLWT